MASEEQLEEVEALASIFGDDFSAISHVEHAITIAPSTDPASNHVTVKLVTSMPSDYPNIPPNLTIEVVKGLNSKQASDLLELANNCAQENVGMPSVFVICEAVREWLLDNNLPGQDGSMYAEMMRRTQQKELDSRRKEERASAAAQADKENRGDAPTAEDLERIRRRQAGTPVTIESFNAWKQKFEQERRRGEACAAEETDMDRPSGKQLFMMNAAGREDDLVAEGEGTDTVFEFAEDDVEDEDGSDYEDEEQEDDDDDDEA